MKKTDFGAMRCPIARSLGKVGEWWSILILRDAFYGLSRFDEFEKSLNIAPNMLSRRLSDLVASGLLEKFAYSEKPTRHAYRLTEAGRDFRPVLWAMLEWGNKHFAPEGTSVQVVNRDTGEPVQMALVDIANGKPIDSRNYRVAPGPAASEGMRYRLAFEELRRSDPSARFSPPAADRVPA